MRSPDARQSLALFAPTRNPFTAALLVLSLIPDVIWLGGLAEEGMEAAERDRLFEERLRNAASQDQAPRAQAPPSAPIAEAPLPARPLAEGPPVELPASAVPRDLELGGHESKVSPKGREWTPTPVKPRKPLSQVRLKGPDEPDELTETVDLFEKLKMIPQPTEPGETHRPALPVPPGGQPGR